MIGIFQIFIFVHLLLISNSIHLYMCEACLGLPRCVVETYPFSEFLILVCEALVDAVLVSPIFYSFQSREVS